MRSRLPISLLLVRMLSLASIAVATSANPSSTATEGLQVIDVTAKKYDFNPSPIRVKRGAKVQLKITATDHAHGFQISEFPNGADSKAKAGLLFTSPHKCTKIEKGQTGTIEFVAETPGTYPFKCCVHCGWHHGDMKGELIVEP